MITRVISYTDFDGNTRSEEFRFHLTDADLTMLQLGVDGGFLEHLRRLVSTQNAPEIMKTFREIIRKSYGEKSADGKRFVRINEATGRPLYEEFEATNAYSELFMELCNDPEKMAAFVRGILPPNAQAAIEKAEKDGTLANQMAMFPTVDK